MARAQALAKLGGQINIVYVRAASAAAVGAVTGEISRLLPSARVTNSASLAGGMAGSLQTTARLACATSLSKPGSQGVSVGAAWPGPAAGV